VTLRNLEVVMSDAPEMVSVAETWMDVRNNVEVLEHLYDREQGGDSGRKNELDKRMQCSTPFL
jgi:hypothetical protein